MEMASAGGDPDGSPRLHGGVPCRWLAGGRVKPEAGWLASSDWFEETSLDGS